MKKEIPFIYVVIALSLLVIIFGSYYLLYSKGGMTGHATTSSQWGNLSVGVQTAMACTWSAATLNVSFGSALDPGTVANASANYFSEDNSSGYNVTVSTLSTHTANVTITGKDLYSGANFINVSNVTWRSNSTALNGSDMVYANSRPLNASAYNVFSGLAIGGNGSFRFWLNISSNVIAGTYVGNYTMTCIEA